MKNINIRKIFELIKLDPKSEAYLYLYKKDSNEDEYSKFEKLIIKDKYFKGLVLSSASSSCIDIMNFIKKSDFFNYKTDVESFKLCEKQADSIIKNSMFKIRSESSSMQRTFSNIEKIIEDPLSIKGSVYYYLSIKHKCKTDDVFKFHQAIGGNFKKISFRKSMNSMSNQSIIELSKGSWSLSKRAMDYNRCNKFKSSDNFKKLKESIK